MPLVESNPPVSLVQGNDLVPVTPRSDPVSAGARNDLIPVVQRNDLARLQLEIARRADQLAPLVIRDRATDLALWEQAEQEVFARHQPAPGNVTDL